MSKFKMTINLNVLNHLGLRLYSNIPAVLSETVANAWDADATEVKIDVTKDEKGENVITIRDNGDGMDEDDINNKYLMVGFSKRDNGAKVTDRGRAVMGRKGIGKLSLFSIAKSVEIYTVKPTEEGIQYNAFKMDTTIMEETIEGGEQDYEPEVIEDAEYDFDKGTKIVLKEIKKSLRLGSSLRKRLARRFGIIGAKNDFEVIVDGKPINIQDRDYFHKIEYMWYYGEDSKYYPELCKNLEKDGAFLRNNTIKIDGKEVKVTGWLGLVDNSSKLQDEDDENLNKIVLMMRGKMAQEDMLVGFREGGLYTKFLFGELRADFLDDDGEDDIATSSRQTIIEHDPRFKALKKWLNIELKNIEKERARLKYEEGHKDAMQYPSIKEWFGSLRGETKKRAKKLFGKLNSISTDDKHKRELFTHGVLAFENLRYRSALEALEEVSDEGIEAFLKIFDIFDDIEATLYYRITKERLAIIDKLKEKVHDENALERILQDHLHEHLWLLDPSWDRATEKPYMEQRVETEFGAIDAKLSKEEAAGRVDIKYKKASGKHIIIELKRSSIAVHDADLQKQVMKYESGLRKILDVVEVGENSPIEMVCILGREPSNWSSSNRQRQIEGLARMNIRVVTYQKLIQDAYTTYQNYLEASRESKKVIELLEKIEADFSIDLTDESGKVIEVELSEEVSESAAVTATGSLPSVGATKPSKGQRGSRKKNRGGRHKR